MEKNEEWDGNVEEGDEDDSDFNAADAESESGSEAEEGATELEGPEDEVGGLELCECFVRGQCTG